jgi:hypothetical protein
MIAVDQIPRCGAGAPRYGATPPRVSAVARVYVLELNHHLYWQPFIYVGSRLSSHGWGGIAASCRLRVYADVHHDSRAAKRELQERSKGIIGLGSQRCWSLMLEREDASCKAVQLYWTARLFIPRNSSLSSLSRSANGRLDGHHLWTKRQLLVWENTLVRIFGSQCRSGRAPLAAAPSSTVRAR